MTERPTRWNHLDTVYVVLGASAVAVVWGGNGPDIGVVVAGWTVIVYAAGRAAGTHR